ncbi:MAG: hypothetical protein ACI865_000631 [Flavobacteriaceae bacterium]|jgi:hypothetical protein
MKIPMFKEIARFEKQLVMLFFIALWSYLIVRAANVFFIHDEIVTKWVYMVDWNFIPGTGYVDANNHFLSSFLGGLFMRLFNSDSLLVVRLGSVLAFPLYFWSVFGLRKFFSNKVNFYALLIGLSCTALIVEYFGLARGYGISFAFLLAGMQQMLSYINGAGSRSLTFSVLAWLLAICANLTLIPFAASALIIMFVFALKGKSKGWIILPLLGFIPLAYFINYSFQLQGLGKLYYGGEVGFIESTIHSLTPHIWNVQHLLLDVLLIIISLFIGFVFVRNYWKNKRLFAPTTLFSLFFLLAIGNIFGQQWLLGINYPEDRTALYLVIFFLGAIFFTIDAITKRSGFSIGYMILTIGLFGFNFNITHSILHQGEQLDPNNVSLIPNEVNSTPPSTGGRWAMENEMNRMLKLPMRMFQLTDKTSDTLVDYMVYTLARRPDLDRYYHPIYTDVISGQTLFERNNFLERTEISRIDHELFGNGEFFDLKTSGYSSPQLIRISGQLNEIDDESDIYFVFSSKDTLSGIDYNYEAISIVHNGVIRKDNSIGFDFSYALPHGMGANQFTVYLWNRKEAKLSGKIKTQVYRLGD